MPDANTFDTFIREEARKLRAKDQAPASLAAWEARKKALRASMFAAMGDMPEKDCPLSPKILGTLDREGYRIEKLLFQSRPDVWVTATAYVPTGVTGKVPAVLAVHGHWRGARRDPVVQSRCLGLVKLGFFVLVVDAFGAGERHPTVALGGYHGALVGSTLWPAGMTLLGVQVHENRRAVDYLITRPEVDGTKLGITGASGGGNQSMYAGALDERFSAVVPVCSVGTYQSYLRAACCVCEVLPGALRFTEEGEVLGLVAPRALLVISATKDAYQFSVGEAKKSIAQATPIFKLYDKAANLSHVPFESPHDYSKTMRETMYGWMTLHLKKEGNGKPIPEPKFEVEKPEDLACYPENKRPAGYIFPATLALREGRKLFAWQDAKSMDHREAWDARAIVMQTELESSLGKLPELSKKAGTFAKPEIEEGMTTTGLTLPVEPGLDIAVTIRSRIAFGKVPSCILLHLDGKEEALKDPVAKALIEAGWVVYAPDLRATPGKKPAGVRGAPDHDEAEHSLWIGRPLLGQWVVDVRTIAALMAKQPGLTPNRITVVGLGQAGLVALLAGGIGTDRFATVAAIDTPTSYLTTASSYPDATRMGLLAPGVLKAGDIPHLAALNAPRKVVISGGTSNGKALEPKGVEGAFAFTRKVYRFHKADAALTIRGKLEAASLVKLL